MRLDWTLLILALGALSACHRPSPVVFRQQGLTVTVTEVRNPEREYSTFATRVEGPGASYCWSNGPFGQSSALIRKDLSDVSLKDGFLFVPVSCGGGNASKCRGYQAFATQPKLQWLADITGRWDGRNVVAYEDGVFYDTGDMLEINDLLAHFQSPRYATAYTLSKGRLRFDAAKTWALNDQAFRSAGDDAPGLLYRAGLAKLCGRSDELRAAQAAAETVLNPKGKALFKSSLQRVSPQDVQPNPFMPATLCAATKAG